VSSIKITAWQDKDKKITKCEIITATIVKAVYKDGKSGHMINGKFYPSSEWTFDIEQ
jgi:hypothetical protein